MKPSRHLRKTGGRGWTCLRARVIARDGGCVQCGSADITSFEVDHVVPYQDGGTDSMINLRLLCRQCHKAETSHQRSKRSGRPIVGIDGLLTTK